jgi:hypothetical protein
MEFHGKFNGIPWNSMKKYNEKICQMFMKNFMGFHGKFHGIPWNSMEFNGIQWNSTMEFSMEISMENSMN